MNVLRTKTYFFGVQQNPDGTLNITAEYRHIGNGKWIDSHSAPLTEQEKASLIGSMGGAERLLERCTEVDNLAAYVQERNEANKAARERRAAGDAAKAEERRQRREKEYLAVFGDGKTATESTLENIAVLLKHLNNQNWGSWSLPVMTIGYACHQYDCDGHTATTITLDKPVKGYIKLQYGAPRGHLTAYTQIDRAIIASEEEAAE